MLSALVRGVGVPRRVTAGVVAATAGLGLCGGLLLPPPAVGAPPSELRAVVLDDGHIDMFELTYDTDAEQLVMSVKDDTDLYGLSSAYRPPQTVTIAVDQDLARRSYSDDELGDEYGYDFIPRNKDIYWLDMNQEPDLPWAGWSTEQLNDSLPAGTRVPHEEGAVEFEVEVRGSRGPVPVRLRRLR